MNKNQDSVGVRELRQNLSIYLRRVASGEKLRVTEHGRTVAALVPLHDEDSVVERLVRQGRLIQAKGDLLELGPPQGPASTRASDALAELRQERL